MRYLKLFAPFILSAILVITVRPVLDMLFPCLQLAACGASPISNEAFVYSVYGLLTGEQTRLLVQLGVFALVGLVVAKRRLLLWNFVLYVSIASIHTVWVTAEIRAKSEYVVSDMFVVFVLKAIVLYGVMFWLTAFVFSLSGDSVPVLQRFRKAIDETPAWQRIAALAVINAAVVLL